MEKFFGIYRQYFKNRFFMENLSTSYYLFVVYIIRSVNIYWPGYFFKIMTDMSWKFLIYKRIKIITTRKHFNKCYLIGNITGTDSNTVPVQLLEKRNGPTNENGSLSQPPRFAIQARRFHNI